MSTGSLYLDITQIFVTVNYKIFLFKIVKFGLFYNWVFTYLKYKTQKKNLKIKCGGYNYQRCPSIIIIRANYFSRVLFSFMNYLCEAEFNGCVTAFADDTALSYSSMNSNNLHTLLQEYLEHLNVRFAMNALSLTNETKCYEI